MTASYGLDVAFHPWRELRARRDIEVVFTDALPEDIRGETDGHTIWMDSSQLQAERRCTLVHELEHIDRGHTCAVTHAQEMLVRVATARRLIPLDRLASSIAWSRNEYEIAETLHVDVDVVRDRLATLDIYETEFVEKTIAAIEEGL